MKTVAVAVLASLAVAASAQAAPTATPRFATPYESLEVKGDLSCEDYIAAETVVTLTRKGQSKRFVLAAPCGRCPVELPGYCNLEWTLNGNPDTTAAEYVQLKGMDVTTGGFGDIDGLLKFEATANNVRWKMIVQFGGRTVLTRRIVTNYRSAGTDGNVYQGTDEFVNYCIAEGKPIRSRRGRLYCTRTHPSEQDVEIHKLGEAAHVFDL